MSKETLLNGESIVTLDEALAGETLAPSIHPEFSVLLVGILKLNADHEERSEAVRLYPPSGQEDNYYLIQRTDIDADRVELLGPEVAAAKGWLGEKVVRIRVRPSAEVIAVHSRRLEADEICDCEMAAGACQGTHCAPGYECVTIDGERQCVNATGTVAVPCPNCT